MGIAGLVGFRMSVGLFYVLEKHFPGNKCILLKDEDWLLKEDVGFISRHTGCTRASGIHTRFRIRSS